MRIDPYRRISFASASAPTLSLAVSLVLAPTPVLAQADPATSDTTTSDALTATVATEVTVDVPTVERFTTSDGAEVLHVPLPDADYGLIAMFWPNAIAFAEPSRAGLFALGTNLPLQQAGGRSLEEIGEALDDARQGLVFANSLSGTAMTLIAQADADTPFVEAAMVASDVLKDPALDPDDLADRQDEIADNLAAAERNPNAMAELAMGTFIGGSDPRLPALTNRPVESVTSVRVDDVRAFLDRAIHTDPIVVAAGPMDEAAIAAAVDQVLADLPPAPDTSPPTPTPIPYERAGQTLAVDAPYTEQAIIIVPLMLPVPSPAAGASVVALAGGDGSRLFTELREELGATYGVEVRPVPLLPDTQLVNLVASVPPERADEALRTMREAIATVREDGVTDAELAAMREQTLATIARRNADPGGTLNTVLDRIVGMGDADALDTAAVTDLLAMDARTLEAADLAAINAALPELLPERATAIVLTPQPDAIEADCTVDAPEKAANCPK